MIQNKLLYIIGNGFDRHHGFRTSYCNFEDFMKDWSREMYCEIHEYWKFKVKDGKWCDFENDLSSYNSSKIYNYYAEKNRTPEDIANNCSSLTQKLFNGLTNCFIEWVKGIQLEPRTKLISLNQNAQCINFNYTLTLQYIYKISENAIWHIHGSSIDNNIIIGHKVKQNIGYNYSDDTGMPSTIEEWDEEAWRYAKLPLSLFRKKTEKVISKNKSRFLNYCDLESIYVLGHSLADVDLPYFEIIYESNKKTKWYISFYNDSEQEHLCSQLKKVGVQESQIKMIKINDLTKK